MKHCRHRSSKYQPDLAVRRAEHPRDTAQKFDSAESPSVVAAERHWMVIREQSEAAFYAEA
jgi:hypothetical protein